MKGSNQYKIKSKKNGIILPQKTIDILSSASESDMKVLFAIAYLEKNGNEDIFSFCEKAGIEKENVAVSLGYLRGAGLIEKTNATKPEEPEIDVTFDASSRPTYTSKELAAVKSTPEFSRLTRFVEKKYGKTLLPNDIATLYSFTDYLSLPVEVIMLVIEHCSNENKNSLKYVEKLLYDFADKEINTYEKAEEYIRQRTEFKSFEGQIRKLMGLGARALSKKESAMLNAWQNEYGMSLDMISLAYDRTVDKTGKATMSYMNKILENWHTLELGTPEEVESGDKKPSGESSFDPNEFFTSAIAKTYNEKKD